MDGLCISCWAENRLMVYLENVVSVPSSILKSNTIIRNVRERDKTKTESLILVVV